MSLNFSLLRSVVKSELGKVFSLLASLEAAVPLFAGSSIFSNLDVLSNLYSSAPLFTWVYNNTLDTFPGAVFLVQASLFAFSCGIFVYIYVVLNRSGRDFSVLVEEQEEDYTVSHLHMFNRPGVAGAVLHTASSLIHSFIQ